MAACAYLFDAEESTLLMAKCKLPSVKATSTIPKMEMNAITIASRLALSIFKALNGRMLNDIMDMYILSDSQIALSWLGT